MQPKVARCNKFSSALQLECMDALICLPSHILVAPCRVQLHGCIGISSRRRKDARVCIKKLVQVAPPACKNVPVSADPSKHKSVALTLMVKECARKNKGIIYWPNDASY